MVQLRRSARVRRRSEQSNASNTSDVDPTEDRKEMIKNLQPLVEEIKEEEETASSSRDVIEIKEDDVTSQGDDVITVENDVIEQTDNVIEVKEESVEVISSDDDDVDDAFMDAVMDESITSASQVDLKKLKLKFVAGETSSQQETDPAADDVETSKAVEELVSEVAEKTPVDEEESDELEQTQEEPILGRCSVDNPEADAVVETASVDDKEVEDESNVIHDAEAVAEENESDAAEESGGDEESEADEESSGEDESDESSDDDDESAESEEEEVESDDDDVDMDVIADDILGKLGIPSATTNANTDDDEGGKKACSFGEGIVKVKDTEEKRALSTAIKSDLNLEDTYITVDESNCGQRKILDLYSSLTNDKNSIFKHSVIQADFATKESVPQEKTKKQQQKERRKERKQTMGKKWYHMRAPEMTDDIKRDLEVLQMRNVLDPKRFYKHNDRKTLPKYFQMGTIMENSADYYSSRLTKKQRKQTLVDELLADAEFKNFQKRKYNEIQAKQRATGHFRKKKRKKV